MPTVALSGLSPHLVVNQLANLDVKAAANALRFALVVHWCLTVKIAIDAVL